MQVLVVSVHGGVAIIAEVGGIIIAIPGGGLVLTEITKFNL